MKRILFTLTRLSLFHFIFSVSYAENWHLSQSCESDALLTAHVSRFDEPQRLRLQGAINQVQALLPDWIVISDNKVTDEMLQQARRVFHESFTRELSPETQDHIAEIHQETFIRASLREILDDIQQGASLSLVAPHFRWLVGNFNSQGDMPYLRLEHEYIHAGLQSWGDWNFHQAWSKVEMWLLLEDQHYFRAALAQTPLSPLNELREFIGSLLNFSAEAEAAQMILARYSAWRKSTGAQALLWSEFSAEGEERLKAHTRKLEIPAFTIFMAAPPVLTLQRYIAKFRLMAPYFARLKRFADQNESELLTQASSDLPTREIELAFEIRRLIQLAFAKLERAGITINVENELLELPDRQRFYELSVDEAHRLTLYHSEDFSSPELIRQGAVRAFKSGSFTGLNEYLAGLTEKFRLKDRRYQIFDERLESRTEAKLKQLGLE